MLRYISGSIVLVAGIISALYFFMKSEKNSINSSTFYREYSNIKSPKFARSIPFKGEANNLRVYNDNYFLKRFDTQLIVQLDSAGNEIATYGRSKNTGVSMFSFIIFWTITNKGIEVVDGKTNTITYIDFNGTISKTVQIPRKVMRAMRLNEDAYLLKTPDPADATNEIYEVFDLQKMEVNEVDFPSSDLEHKDFVFDGFFVSNQYDKIYHICYKTGKYFCFDNSGFFLYEGITVDASDAPVIIVTHDGAKRYHPLTIKVNRSAAATTNELYILSGKGAINSPEERGDLIDVYESSTGKYKNTFVLPYYHDFAAYELVVYKDKLLALQGNYIVEYFI